MTVNTPIGKITANEGVLNKIALAFMHSGDYYVDIGLVGNAKSDFEIGKRIHDELERVGYYN